MHGYSILAMACGVLSCGDLSLVGYVDFNFSSLATCFTFHQGLSVSSPSLNSSCSMGLPASRLLRTCSVNGFSVFWK